MREFDLYQRSYRVKTVERKELASYLAFQNQAVQATEGKGKSIRAKYKKFEDFFDYSEALGRALHPQDYKDEQAVQEPSLADKNLALRGRR